MKVPADSAVAPGMAAIGLILRPHGIKGELRVRSLTDYEDRFAPGNRCLVASRRLPLTVEAARPFKEDLLVRFAEVEDRTAAESLSGLLLQIPDGELRPLPAGGYWLHDIIGLLAVTEDGEELGRVVDVLQSAAHDLYEVAPMESSRLQERFLLPAVAQVIRDIDVKSGRMAVRLPQGLLHK